jgi:hypothetical protein
MFTRLATVSEVFSHGHAVVSRPVLLRGLAFAPRRLLSVAPLLAAAGLPVGAA